jgi:hypothetical protein
MMGRLKSDQGQIFYEFQLGDAVPEDHLVRKIDAALDPGGCARSCPTMKRPSMPLGHSAASLAKNPAVEEGNLY